MAAPDDLTPEQRLRRLQAENINFRQTNRKLTQQMDVTEWLLGQVAAHTLCKYGNQSLNYEIRQLPARAQQTVLQDARSKGHSTRPRYLVVTITAEKGVALTYTDDRAPDPQPRPAEPRPHKRRSELQIMPPPPHTIESRLNRLFEEDYLNPETIASYGDDDAVPAAECARLASQAASQAWHLDREAYSTPGERTERWAEVRQSLERARDLAIACENGCVAYEDPGDPDRLEQEWRWVQSALTTAMYEAAIQAAYWQGRAKAHED